MEAVLGYAHAATPITGSADLWCSTTETMRDPDFAEALRVHKDRAYMTNLSHLPAGLDESIITRTSSHQNDCLQLDGREAAVQLPSRIGATGLRGF